MADSPDVLAGKVLIVDDQHANVLLLERMLRGAGYSSVTSTQDPRQVAELERANHYDLILLDLQMAGFDGFRVLEALPSDRENGGPWVIVMTAHPGNEPQARQAGAKGFISKPFIAPDLLTCIYNLLEKRLERPRSALEATRPLAGPER